MEMRFEQVNVGGVEAFDEGGGAQGAGVPGEGADPDGAVAVGAAVAPAGDDAWGG